MHEISLVRSIINSLQEEFSESDLERLEQIDLKVGLLSNIEPQLMHNAFDAVSSAENVFPEVKLSIETVPIEIHCKDCDKNSVIENYKFACQFCNTPNNNVVKGTELLIHQVHFEED